MNEAVVDVALVHPELEVTNPEGFDFIGGLGRRDAEGAREGVLRLGVRLGSELGLHRRPRGLLLLLGLRLLLGLGVGLGLRQRHRLGGEVRLHGRPRGLLVLLRRLMLLLLHTWVRRPRPHSRCLHHLLSLPCSSSLRLLLSLPTHHSSALPLSLSLLSSRSKYKITFHLSPLGFQAPCLRLTPANPTFG